MDLSAYAALGGVERVAVIIGALVIGYWGYRLYARDKTPGLIFMGLACVVLVLALATGGAYVRSVGTSYQLAGAQPEHDAPPAQTSVSGETDVAADAAQPLTEATAGAGAAALETAPGSAESAPSAEPKAESVADGQKPAAGPPAADPQSAAVPVSEDVAAAAQIDARQPAAEASPIEDVDLASSQELGGRIVSVKSDKITLEWSRE